LTAWTRLFSPLTAADAQGALWRMVVVGVLTLLARLPFAIWFPVLSPDGEGYVLVADNIFQNGCVSMSVPASGACVPHWGGNHPPAYPLLLAAVGGSLPGLLIVQILLYAAAAARLVTALEHLLERPRTVLAVGLVVALSPLQFGWGRFVLPDLLSSAMVIWMLAEITLSFAQGRLRTLAIGLCLAAASFLRYDGILLAVPVAVAGFWIHPPLTALRKGLVITLIVAIPIMAWLARGVAVGLGPVPEQRFMQDGSRTPDGYRAWGRTWISTLYQGAAFGYPVTTGRFNQISIPAKAYDNDNERRRVEALLGRLGLLAGQPFPLKIDNAFAELAAERRTRHPVRTYVVLPIQRAGSFWLNPFYSFGLPGLELSSALSRAERLIISEGALGEKITVALRYPGAVVGKAVLAGYRYLLVTLFVIGMIILLRRSAIPERGLGLSILAFVLLRTGVLSYHSSIDSRYMIGAIAAAEIAVILAFGRKIGERRTPELKEPDG